MTEVTLKEGEMLWLPAGWFHEVTSASSRSTPAHGGNGGGGRGAEPAAPGGHLAMNYWFHPPDSADFEAPYSGKFWPHDWAKRLHKRRY